MQIGDRTYLHGWKWTDGEARSFVQRSSDRHTWTKVEVTDELAERGLFITALVDDGTGRPLALASTIDHVVAVDLTTGDLFDLPAASGGLSPRSSLAASRRERIVVLVTALTNDSRIRLLPYVSTDRGRTWTPGTPLPGAEAWSGGVVATRDGFVATGSTLNGNDRRAVAWFSPDGLRWKRERLPSSGYGLGVDATSLSSCTRAGDVTLVQGEASTSTTWRTTDGIAFDRVSIGDERDWVGTITAVPGEFAAPGAVSAGSRYEAVLWISRDGNGWRSIALPVKRPMTPAAVRVWGGRLVVPLTGESGPGMTVLDNLTELLTE